jgi:hypothetical protein
MTARSTWNWGNPRLTRHRVVRAVVCRCRWTHSYRWVHNAARGAANRFLVRAAYVAAGVLGRPVGHLGCWAARRRRARAPAPNTAWTTSATLWHSQS